MFLNFTYRHIGDLELRTSLSKLAVASSLLFATSTSLAGLETGLGEHVIDEKYNSTNACLLAEQKAIKQALDKHSGKQFTVEKKNFCYDTKDYSYCNYYKEYDYTTAGTIRKIVSRKETITNSTCRVALVADLEELPRSIQVNVQGKNIYFVDEPLNFRIKVNEPVYFYMFNVHRKGVEFLYPSRYYEDNRFEDDFEFPGLGLRYVTTLDTGVRKDEEQIILLFTKHQLDFDRVALDHHLLHEIINSIPVHSRKTFTYKILIKRK